MMNFDKIVKQILQENRSRLPVLDGEREIYIRSVSIGDGMCFGTFDREGDYNIEEWDDDYNDYGARVICITKNFKEALEELRSAFSDQKNQSNSKNQKPNTLPPEAIEKITKDIGYLIGTWKVMWDLANSNCLMIGVDVDIETYRVGGIRDSVRTTVDGDVDISAW